MTSSKSLLHALSPKRNLSSSNDSIPYNVKENVWHYQRKKVKILPSASSPDKQESILNKRLFIAVLGSLHLTWPKYGINNGIYAGQSFSVTRTCSVDTGLFVLYHAYRVGSDEFRNLFNNNEVNAFAVLRETFQYVESHDWTVARLHWLVQHRLLDAKMTDGRYDLQNTLSKIVFDFVKPMQEFDVSSECTCNVCPKRIRKHSSVDITLR